MYARKGICGGIMVFMLMFLHGIAYAQDVETKATLHYKYLSDSARIYRPRRVMLLLSLDRRYTFLETPASVNTPINLYGVKAGLNIEQRSRTGIGFYTLRERQKRITRQNGQTVDVEFTFRYFTAFYEYYFFHTRRWDIGLPLEAGIGRYRALNGSIEKEGLVVPTGIAVSAYYRPIRWASLTAMGGYRFVGNNSSLVKLNNWFYAFGVALSTRNIYDDSRFWLVKRRYNKDMAKL